MPEIPLIDGKRRRLTNVKPRSKPPAAVKCRLFVTQLLSASRDARVVRFARRRHLDCCSSHPLLCSRAQCAPRQCGPRSGSSFMRRTVWMLGGALAAAIAGPVAAETPKDTVVMAKQIDDLISLDPAEVFEFSGGEIIGNVYDGLLDFNPAKVSEIRGRIAESWSVADDGRTYTFKLRSGLKFASGNPITADDMVWSLHRAVILNKAPGFILTQFGFTKDNIKERIKATDPATVVLVTEKTIAPTFLYYCLTSNVAKAIDHKTVEPQVKGEDLGNEWLKAHS